MPGFFTSSTLQRHGSRAHLYDPLTRLPPVYSETSGLQVTDADHATRKRSRFASIDIQGQADSSAPRIFDADFWPHSLRSSRSPVRSPPPLANDRYALAGGMDTTDKLAGQTGDFDDYFHLEKQREAWSTPTSPHDENFVQSPVVERHSTPGASKPWMINQLMSIVGGVAGKLYHFCSVPFRGFQAGGGQAYSFDNQEVATKLGLHEDVEQEETKNLERKSLASLYADENYGVLSVESLDHARPGAKRQRTGDSWVVVQNDGDMISRPSTPRVALRRVPMLGSSSPSQPPQSASSASMTTPAYKRPSLIPVSRRSHSTIDTRSFHSSFTPESTPQSRHGRSYSHQSYASPVVFSDRGAKKKHSPLPPESQRLIDRMRREETEDEARMRRMSSQMTAMLREARAALGSTFEIEDEYLDEDGSDDASYHNSLPMLPR